MLSADFILLVQLGLGSLVENQYLGAKQLPVPSPSDDTILYYPGPKLIERIRQAEASLSNHEKALLIIQRRVRPEHPRYLLQLASAET